MTSKHIWNMMTLLARMNFVVHANLVTNVFRLEGVEFTLGELEHLIEEDIWQPLV